MIATVDCIMERCNAHNGHFYAFNIKNSYKRDLRLFFIQTANGTSCIFPLVESRYIDVIHK